MAEVLPDGPIDDEQRVLGALAWMFRQTKIPWDRLFQASVGRALERNGLRDGVLTADDSDHRRAKRIQRIHATHTVFDKKTGAISTGRPGCSWCW